MAYLIDFLVLILEWVVEFVVWAFHTIYELLLEGLVIAFEAIPVPDWLVGADPFAGIDPGVVFFLEAFEIPSGITIILGAYLVRFLVRRLPVIG